MSIQRVLRKFLAVSGAIMLAAMPFTAAAGGSPSDVAITREVNEALDRYVNSVSVDVEHGHVYLKGTFDTQADKSAAVRHIKDIDGVRSVYDYTEEIGGEN